MGAKSVFLSCAFAISVGLSVSCVPTNSAKTAETHASPTDWPHLAGPYSYSNWIDGKPATSTTPAWRDATGGYVVYGVASKDRFYCGYVKPAISGGGQDEPGISGITCHELQSGAFKWKFSTPNGTSVYTTLLDRNSVGLVVAQDSVETVIVLDATTGKERWRKAITMAVALPCNLAGAGRLAVVETSTGEGSNLLVLETLSGKQLGSMPIQMAAAPAYSADAMAQVMFGGNDLKLIDEEFKTTKSVTMPFDVEMAVGDGRDFVATSMDKSQYVFLSNWVAKKAQKLAGRQLLAKTPETLLLRSGDKFSAIESLTGKRLWEKDFPGVSTASASGANWYAIGKNVTSYNLRDGSKVKTFSPPGEPLQIVPLAQGIIIVTVEGGIYRYR